MSAVPNPSLELDGDGGCAIVSLWNYGQRRLRRHILLSERRLRRRHLLPGFSRPQPGQQQGCNKKLSVFFSLFFTFCGRQTLKTSTRSERKFWAFFFLACTCENQPRSAEFFSVLSFTSENWPRSAEKFFGGYFTCENWPRSAEKVFGV